MKQHNEKTRIIDSNQVPEMVMALSAIRLSNSSFWTTLEWNGQHFNVEFPPQHVLYDSIFDIFLLSKLNEEANKNNKQLAQDVYALCNVIINYLESKPKIPMNDVAEEHRWSFLLIALGHVSCQLHTRKIVEDIQPFELQARELTRALKPYIKSNHKYAQLYRRHINFDLDIMMGSYYSAKGDLDLSENYYNRALRYCVRCVPRDHPKHNSSMFTILDGLSEIHFNRGDYLAAEVQYDYTTRFMAPEVMLNFKSDALHSKVNCVHHELANHYQRKNRWIDERRLRTKTIEVIELFMKKSVIPKARNDIALQAKKIQAYNQFRLSTLQFFHEMPDKLRQHFSSINANTMTLIASDSTIYPTIYKELEKAGILRKDGSSAEQLTLKVLLSATSNVPAFFSAALNTIQPPAKSQKAKTIRAEPPTTQPETVANSIDQTDESLKPLPHIPDNWKAKQKGTTARAQRGNKSAGVKKHKEKTGFFIDQHRAIPQITVWQDPIFGELVFSQVDANCNLIVMRNEHNCGKPVFGYLPTELMRTLLSKHYNASEAEKTLAEISKTFSEAKQAGFFGRGIKSCPNLPILRGTDYKLEIKPSRDFKPIIRVFGRHIKNGEHTLFIFDALDRNPKSAASKLELLRPEALRNTAESITIPSQSK